MSFARNAVQQIQQIKISRPFIVDESVIGIMIGLFNHQNKKIAVVMYFRSGGPHITTVGCESPMSLKSAVVQKAILDHVKPLYDEYKESKALECFHPTAIESMISQATWKIEGGESSIKVTFSYGDRVMVSVTSRIGRVPEMLWNFREPESENIYVSTDIRMGILQRVINVLNQHFSQKL